jgi:hypothetical protein
VSYARINQHNQQKSEAIWNFATT